MSTALQGLVRRPLLAAVFISLAVAVVQPPAPAEGRIWVVRGHGWGHGVGMSQYGAYGFARRGRGYRRILGHYYRRTRVASAGSRTIRVLLTASQGGSTSFRGASRLGRRRINPGRRYLVRRSGGRIVVRAAGGRVIGRYRRPIKARRPSGTVRLLRRAINGVSGGAYRGALELRPGLYGGVSVINPVGLDDYVKGVVPGEVPASWPREALKAQAVAARSYALATDAGGPIFDQYPDTRSQVYRGAGGEHARTNAAVRATSRQVVKYRGRVATTFFFSTSGGRTENVENSFLGASPSPYLKSVRDPYDFHSPLHRWTLRFSQRRMEARLGGLVRGRFRGISVNRRGRSPRIVSATIRGSRGRRRVSGPTLRFRLGLYDTWAYFARARRSASSSASLPALPGPGRPPGVAGTSVPPVPR